MTLSTSEITQPGCSTPDTSEACRSLTIDTLVVGAYDIVFRVTANGGASPVTVTVPLKIDCSSTMPIIVPNPL